MGTFNTNRYFGDLSLRPNQRYSSNLVSNRIYSPFYTPSRSSSPFVSSFRGVWGPSSSFGTGLETRSVRRSRSRSRSRSGRPRKNNKRKGARK